MLAITMVTLSAKANQEKLPIISKMKVNVRYLLTENRAKALKIDLDLLRVAMAVKESEQVAVLLDENAQLNLSIFDQDAFNQFAMDIVK